MHADVKEQRLIKLGHALIDQAAARVIVEPNSPESGFWFGGGNMLELDGDLYVVGRFRNAGDSRLGVTVGTRGLELAVFRSDDRGQRFRKVASWSKNELNVDQTTVLSIEGAALFADQNGVQLFVSTEKDGIGYPAGFDSYLKPGTGVWTIDRLTASSIDQLKDAEVRPFLSSNDPEHLHVKDPFVHTNESGQLTVLYCSHPFAWTSSNTCAATIGADGTTTDPLNGLLERGTTWDVAMTRGTAVVDVPQVGAFADERAQLLFYDGGECVRNLDEHAAAVKRPRGYSCEELGGLAWMPTGSFADARRVSRYEPMFISPHGTGCSRYVDVLTTRDGMYATWQQAQADGSQPLVMNFLPTDEITRILS